MSKTTLVRISDEGGQHDILREDNNLSGKLIGLEGW
jgi:hypothetical protein